MHTCSKTEKNIARDRRKVLYVVYLSFLPDSQNHFFNIRHVLPIKLSDSQIFEEILDRRHRITTGQFGSRIINDKCHAHFVFGGIPTQSWFLSVYC